MGFQGCVCEGKEVNAFVLVVKMDRNFEEIPHRDLKYISTMMQHLNVDLGKHLMVVVTHSILFSDEAKERFSDELHIMLKEHLPNLGTLPREHILHVNFANWDELDELGQTIFKHEHKKEYLKMAAAFQRFKEPINPNVYLLNKIGDKKLNEFVHRDIAMPNVDAARWNPE